MTLESRTQRPAPTEHEAYYSHYISLTPDGDLAATLAAQIAKVGASFGSVSPQRETFTYETGKWTIREVLGHLIDTERVFAYRATAFSRGDTNPLPSFDQAAWAPHGNYNARTLSSLLDEWAAVRRATIALVENLPDAAWGNVGTASGFQFTTRAALWILPGHVEYHLAHLRSAYGLAPR